MKALRPHLKGKVVLQNDEKLTREEGYQVQLSLLLRQLLDCHSYH